MLFLHILLQIAVLEKMVADGAVVADAHTAYLLHDVNASNVIKLIEVGILAQLTILLDDASYLQIIKRSN